MPSQQTQQAGVDDGAFGLAAVDPQHHLVGRVRPDEERLAAVAARERCHRGAVPVRRHPATLSSAAISTIVPMTEYQLTSWRELPSLVVARNSADPADSGSTVKAPMPPRFQEAIDEAAMRLGETSSDAYLEGWVRSDWTTSDGTPTQVADRVVADLDSAVVS